MSAQVSEAEEQEQLQVDSIKEQEGSVTQAKRAAALARWRRLQASLLIVSRGTRCKLATVLINPNTESHALCQFVNIMVLFQASRQLASDAFLPKLTLKLPVSILLCPPLDCTTCRSTVFYASVFKFIRYCCKIVASAGVQCTLVSSGSHTFAEQYARPGSPSGGGSGLRQV